MVRTFLILTLVCSIVSLDPARAQEAPMIVKAWASLIQSMAQVEKYVSTSELSGVHSEDLPMSQAVSILLGESDAIRAGALEEAKVALVAFARKVGDMHAAADAFDLRKTAELLAEVRREFQSVGRFYAKDMLAAAQRLAERYICPMHPEEAGRPVDRCSKCGMAIDQPVKIVLHGFGGSPVRETIAARVRTGAPLSPGRAVAGTLELSSFGRPILITDLRVVHTERIHLLIVDPTLTDYHHVHPQPTDVEGAYRFEFTPRKPGRYRAWADVRSTTTGLQEFAMADLGAPVESDAVRDTSVSLRAESRGLRFELAFAAPPGSGSDRREGEIAAGEAVRATLRVTGADGRPFAALEPVMSAFAHIVGFAEDYKTVLHSHPAADRPLNPADRGGPELAFQVYATQPGFYRLFAQVQVDGAAVFAPFGIYVRPTSRAAAAARGRR